MNPPLRVRLLTTGLWILLLSGPTLACAALIGAAGREEPAQPPTAPPGVLAFAELVVAQHLTAGLEAAAPVLQPAGAAPTTHDGDTRRVARRAPLHVSATTSRPAGARRFGVTVLAAHHNGRVSAWQVTVSETDDGPQLERPPAALATPSAGDVTSLALGAPAEPDPEDPVAATARGFLTALLTGSGDLPRYTTPTSRFRALSHPFQRIDVVGLATDAIAADRVVAAVAVTAVDDDGVPVRLEYPLLLHARGGRWEVDRILPALPPAPVAR